MGCTHRLVVLLAFFAVLVIACSARADSLLDSLPKVQSEQAHDHVRKGNAFYRTGQFEQALGEYRLALEIEPADVIVYNIAQCDRMLGRWQDAIWTYRRFLSHAAIASSYAERIERYIKDAEQKLAAQREAERQLAASETSHPNGDSAARQTDHERPANGGSSAMAAPPPASDPVPTTRHIHGEPWYRDPIAWTVTGVGLVGVGVGAGLFVSGGHLDEQGNATMGEAQRNTLHARASARRTDGAIIGGLGVAATVTGIVMLVVHPVDHEEPIATWHLGIAGRGIAVSGSF